MLWKKLHSESRTVFIFADNGTPQGNYPSGNFFFLEIIQSTKKSTASPTAFVLPLLLGENGASVKTFEKVEFSGRHGYGGKIWFRNFWIFCSGVKRVSQSEFEGFCVNSFPSWAKFEGNVLGTCFQDERFLYKNAPTYLSRTRHTNAVVGVLQSLFYW